MFYPKSSFVPNGQKMPSARGFSLIETVIALGIMGLAVTALLGLLPHGMEMSRNAATTGAISRIMDTIKSDLAHFNFANLNALGARENLYFDDEGILLQSSAGAQLIAYVAEISNMSAAGQNVVLPGGGQERNLVSFRVRVAASPRAEVDFDRRDPSTYSTMCMHFAPITP